MLMFVGLGSIFIAVESKIELVTTYDEFKEDYHYDTEKKKNFNIQVFLTGLLASTISCSTLYGFGDLIQLNEDQKQLLLKEREGSLDVERNE